ncbi:MAG: glycerate-2-kinase family protein [Pirellulales bacterium]|nr:glycerate-2-kinase family protein [Pirellulales bacterium]
MYEPRQDAVSIWNAGVDAVRARPLVRGAVQIDRNTLRIDRYQWSKSDFDRVLVVGAGKAASGMTAGLLDVIDQWLPISGWINVPEGTEQPLAGVTVHSARPAGVNEPTDAGVEGTRQILKRVAQAKERDLCIALISGGGSALLPAPAEGITLADKLAVIRHLSGAGADIVALNTVRKHLSEVKGGGLLAACRAGHLVTLILSDVLGDPLEFIASGPTVPDTTTAQDALEVLRQFDPQQSLPQCVYQTLDQAPNRRKVPPQVAYTNIVIGNNAVAVDQAGIRAESLGYNHAMQSAPRSEGAAEEVGRHLAQMGEAKIAC